MLPQKHKYTIYLPSSASMAFFVVLWVILSCICPRLYCIAIDKYSTISTLYILDGFQFVYLWYIFVIFIFFIVWVEEVWVRMFCMFWYYIYHNSREKKSIKIICYLHVSFSDLYEWWFLVRAGRFRIGHAAHCMHAPYSILFNTFYTH